MKTDTKREQMGRDFTQGKILPLMIRFTIPFLLANLLNSLYNAVDTVIIGQFVGSNGIVAVTMGGKMLTLFTNVSLAFAGGGQVLISQYVGAKRRNEINSTIGTMLTEMFALSVILAGFTLLLSEQILIWLNTPTESFRQALSYLRITSAGLPLIFGYNAVSSTLRGMGDSRSPLIFIAIAALLNLLGDILLIVVFDLDVIGTAIATVFGQGISLLFSLVVLWKNRERFGFDFRLESFCVDWRKLQIMLKIGFPMALRSLCISTMQLVMISFVNLNGVVQSAAYSIGDKICQVSKIMELSTRQASGTMIAQNVGANQQDRVRTIVRECLCINLSATTILVTVALAMPTAIYGLFTSDVEVLSYARVFMLIACMTFLFSSIMGPFESVIVGTGNSGLSFLGGMLDGVVFRAGFSFLFAYYCGMGTIGFFLSDSLARLGPIIVSMTYFFSGAWKRTGNLIADKSSGQIQKLNLKGNIQGCHIHNTVAFRKRRKKQKYR